MTSVFFREILVVGTGAGDKAIKRAQLHRAIFAAPDIAVVRYPFFVCKHCVPVKSLLVAFVEARRFQGAGEMLRWFLQCVAAGLPVTVTVSVDHPRN